MSANQIDLNIQNYSAKDLEHFFRFGPNETYSASDVEKREYELREQLLTSGYVDKRLKRDLMEFMEKAKDLLIYTKCGPIQHPPTTIPKNARLDLTDYPRSDVRPTQRELDLIMREDKETGKSNMINPSAITEVTKTVNIDTRFRDNYNETTISDFTLNLPVKMTKVTSMKIASMELPISFYGISASYGNNYFYIKVNYIDINTYQDAEDYAIIIIKDGNYEANDLITNLNAQLCPLSTVDNTPLHPDSIFSYIHFRVDLGGANGGSGTGKVNVEPNGVYAANVTGITLDFTLDIHGNRDTLPLTTKLGCNLGFRHKHYTGKTTYIADTMVDPAGIRYIFMAIDDYNNNVNDSYISAYNSSILNQNIMSKISIRGSYFSLIMDGDSGEERKYFGPVDIQRIRVRLFDDHGRILQMNNGDISFSLRFTMNYDK